MRCPFCNSELEDGSRFCGECGKSIPEPTEQKNEQQKPETQQAEVQQPEVQQAEVQQPEVKQPESIYCPQCGKQLAAGSLFCDGCGCNLGAPAGNGAVVTPVPQKEKKKIIPWVIAGVVAVCVVALIGGIAIFAGGVHKSETKIDYSMYVKEKELFYSNLKRKPATQVTENLVEDNNISNYEIQYAGRQLSEYFILTENGKYLFYPDKIDLSDDGFTIYWKELSKLNGQGTKIDSDIQVYAVSDNGAYVAYLKSGDSLYLYDVKKAEKEKISGDVKAFAVSDDGKQVIYVNDEGTLYQWTKGKDKEKIDSEINRVVNISDDFTTLYYLKEDNLYKKENKKDREKIASDVSSVLQVYDSGAIYYLTKAEDELSLDMFITDDMADQDAKMQDPGWGASSEEWEAYYEKGERDYIREQMEDYTPYANIYTLCYYDGKKTTEVSDGYINLKSYGTSEVVFFEVFNTEDINKVKLSKIVEEGLYWYDIPSSVIDDSKTYAVARKGELILIDIEDAYNIKMNSDGTKFLYIDDYNPEKSRGDLCMVSLSKGKLSDADRIDSDVYSENFRFMGDSYLYYMDVNNGHGDLYIDGENVAYDASVGYISSSANGEIYYYVDYDYKDESGTLYHYAKGKSVKVADDVYDYLLMGDDRILLLSNYSTNRYKGELYLFAKNKLNMLDDDVVCFIRPGSSSKGNIYSYWRSTDGYGSGYGNSGYDMSAPAAGSSR